MTLSPQASPLPIPTMQGLHLYWTQSWGGRVDKLSGKYGEISLWGTVIYLKGQWYE